MILISFSVLIIKRAAVIEADKSMASQVRLLNLSDGSPYETLHAYIANAVAPYFKSYVKESGKIERYYHYFNMLNLMKIYNIFYTELTAKSSNEILNIIYNLVSLEIIGISFFFHVSFYYMN